MSSLDINEASGLAASRRNPGVLWTHNDSGGANVVFAISTAGQLLGTYQLGFGTLTDAEDIAVGPGPTPGVNYIYLGDIGDNSSTRSTIRVKRVPEPAVDVNQAPTYVTLSEVEIITLRYPSGADAPAHKDSETLLVDPVNGDIYVITKRTELGRVYRAPFPQSTTETVTLEFVAQLPWGLVGGFGGATGGDVSPDGNWVIVRRYTWYDPQATMWRRPAGAPLWEAFSEPGCNVLLILEELGEAICFAADGRGYYTVGEGYDQALNYFPMLPCTVAADCDDGSPCRDHSCPDGICYHVNNNSNSCDDGLFCTETDVCLNGACVGSGNPCPGQTCDEVSDACVPCHDNADCDDGNPCTDDHCLVGACAHVNNTDFCDDGLGCTHPDTCIDGACVGSDLCTAGWTCSPVTGQCEVQTTTLTFQDGLSGYDGTHDTFLEEGLPDLGHGALDTWEWDGDNGGSGSGQTVGLARFEGIFGSGPGLIPPGITITSALLTLVVSDPGSGTAGSIHECAVTWDESTVTWNTFGGEAGVQPEDLGGFVAAAPIAVGTAIVDVTSSVQAWSNNPAANRGWVFLPNSSDGVEVHSAEQTVLASGRPKLTVTFPGSPVCSGDADCDDGNPCTHDSCVRQACAHIVLPDGTSCADDEWCRGEEVCQSGICTDGPESCEDLPHCDEVHDVCVQCVSDGECSDDDNPCTYEGCVANRCNSAKPDGTPCEDDLYCNGAETCQRGVCTAGMAPCGDACERCDETNDECDWCRYDLDGDGFIGPGDFAFFAGCYSEAYGCDPPEYLSGVQPCCISNFDGSADGFVGPGDFAGLAGCYGRSCSACGTCWGAPPGKGRDASHLPAPIVSVALVAVNAPTRESVADEPPSSARQFDVRRAMYVEIWTRIRATPYGLTAVYVDLKLDPAWLRVEEVITGDLFGLFCHGDWIEHLGLLSSVGGCALLGEESLGVRSWVRVATVKAHVQRRGSTSIQACPATNGYGIAVLNRLGTLETSQIAFSGITVDVHGPAHAVDRLEEMEAQDERTTQDRP